MFIYILSVAILAQTPFSVDAAQNAATGISEVSDEKGEVQLTDPSTAQEDAVD